MPEQSEEPSLALEVNEGKQPEESRPPVVEQRNSLDAGAFDLDDKAFKTDHFRMYEFKVKRCPRARPHDWTQCPFAHPGEKAKRRDPRRYSYSGTACPDFRKNGTCRRGDACPFAHGVFECWLHPSRYRTQTCTDGTTCKRRVCFFAHHEGELRKPEPDSVLLSQQLQAELAAEAQALQQQQLLQSLTALLSAQGHGALPGAQALPFEVLKGVAGQHNGMSGVGLQSGLQERAKVLQLQLQLAQLQQQAAARQTVAQQPNGMGLSADQLLHARQAILQQQLQQQVDQEMRAGLQPTQRHSMDVVRNSMDAGGMRSSIDAAALRSSMEAARMLGTLPNTMGLPASTRSLSPTSLPVPSTAGMANGHMPDGHRLAMHGTDNSFSNPELLNGHFSKPEVSRRFSMDNSILAGGSKMHNGGYAVNTEQLNAAVLAALMNANQQQQHQGSNGYTNSNGFTAPGSMPGSHMSPGSGFSNGPMSLMADTSGMMTDRGPATANRRSVDMGSLSRAYTTQGMPPAHPVNQPLFGSVGPMSGVNGMTSSTGGSLGSGFPASSRANRANSGGYMESIGEGAQLAQPSTDLYGRSNSTSPNSPSLVNGLPSEQAPGSGSPTRVSGNGDSSSTGISTADARFSPGAHRHQAALAAFGLQKQTSPNGPLPGLQQPQQQHHHAAAIGFSTHASGPANGFSHGNGFTHTNGFHLPAQASHGLPRPPGRFSADGWMPLSNQQAMDSARALMQNMSLNNGSDGSSSGSSGLTQQDLLMRNASFDRILSQLPRSLSDVALGDHGLLQAASRATVGGGNS